MIIWEVEHRAWRRCKNREVSEVEDKLDGRESDHLYMDCTCMGLFSSLELAEKYIRTEPDIEGWFIVFPDEVDEPHSNNKDLVDSDGKHIFRIYDLLGNLIEQQPIR